MPKPKRPRSDRDHRVMLIKMGQKQLGLADDAYRDMLFALTGKRSSTEMHDAEHARVLDHLINSGARLNWNRRAHMKIAEEKKPLVSKIRMLLLHLGNRSDGYADALAKRMWRVDRCEWCEPRQLIGIVTALSKELARLRAKGA